MKYGEKIALMFVAFMLAVIFSWLPWLMYGVVASVFTSLTPIGWEQATFFTWVIMTIGFWISE